MTGIGWERRTAALRHELASIESRAHTDSARLRELRRQAEGLKVGFLAHQLESRRRSLARGRGFASVAENGKGLPLALGIATAASILTSIMTKDMSAAVSAGLTGFNRALQGLGETDWAVCLGRNLAVVSRDNITSGQIWVTLDSVKAALCELEEQAKNGAPLGNLDNIISELQKSKRLVFVINAPADGATA